MANSGNKTSARSRPMEGIRGFETPVTAGSLADIPSGCLCTWVPAPGGPTMASDRCGYEPDPRQPWLATLFMLKFPNRDCPAGFRHG